MVVRGFRSFHVLVLTENNSGPDETRYGETFRSKGRILRLSFDQ